MLTKPVRQSVLYDTIASVLAGGANRGEASAPDQDTDGRQYGGQRVLVAEDNPVNQKVARGMLQSLGLEVDVVGNGREAIEAVRNTRYAMVFMDCQMPELDGFEATAGIRGLERGRRRVPIVAMTANAMQGDDRRCILAGMDDYLAKPVKLETLAATVERWLSRNEGLGDTLTLHRPPELAAPPGEPVVERAVLDELRTVMGGDVGEVVEDYLRITPEQIAALEESLQASRLERAARIAHTLKGSSGNLGAGSLAALCATLEQNARLARKEAAVEQLSRLRTQFERVAAELRAYLDGGSA